MSTPIQNALPKWFSLRADIQREIKGRIETNKSFLADSLGTVLQKRTVPELFSTKGGWYTILKLPNSKSEEEWALEFLRKDHVFIHPGYFFDFPAKIRGGSATLFSEEDEAYMILSLLPPPEIFKEGISRILQRIRLSS